MSEKIGEIFGIDVRVSSFVPDGEVYVMNKKTLALLNKVCYTPTKVTQARACL